MKRLIAALIMLIIICILCILNVPKKTLTTTLGTKGSTEIKTTKIETTKVKTTKKVVKIPKVKVNKTEMLDYLYQQVIAQGWNDNDYNAIMNILKRENSNFNISAVNEKSGACGLFQAKPCSKMKKYGSDYKTNYKTQIAFGIDHIKSRYGTPVKAWEFWLNNHWY